MIEQKKADALAILHRMEQHAENGSITTTPASDSGDTSSTTLVDKLFGYTTQRLTSVDPDKAVARVQALRRKYPDLRNEELVERLIKAKCQKAATVGAATSAASVFPGLGTAISVTVGLVVDIGSTLKLHAELVLEIAEAHGHRLDENKRAEVLLAVTGLSAGMGRLGGSAVKGLSQKFSEIAAQKWLAKAVPAVGMAASATTNVLFTYIIGKRAEAYFNRGPEALGDIKDNLRALTGVDEQKIGQWVAESSHSLAQASAKAGSGMIASGRRGINGIAGAGKAVGRRMANLARWVVGHREYTEDGPSRPMTATATEPPTDPRETPVSGGNSETTDHP